MNNLLILFNPYYQTDVIQKHLEVLIENEKVAFGKVRSKLKTNNNFEIELKAIYDDINSKDYLQLFLTDYSNLFVAKVERITKIKVEEKLIPQYYEEKNLDVEQWFIITDLRELVRNDFEVVRDNYLTNFSTPTFDNHTYALYGNNYTYPLIINMKNQEIDYFENEELRTKYYPNIFKSKEFLQIKDSLIKYTFGTKYVNYMHPNTMDNIISAEIEYQNNISNPLYDFSSVIVKYSKTIEQEIYLFSKYIFKFLSKKEPKILNVNYSVQGHDFTIQDIFTNKPNLGTYKFLFRNELIQKSVEEFCDKNLKLFVSKFLPFYINIIQDIRNETVHGNSPNVKDVERLRDKIIGIGESSIIFNLVKQRMS